MTEKEQDMHERDHVQMSQEMIHYHHDHERYDQERYDQEQKPYQSLCEVCVASRATTITGKRHNQWTVTLRGFRWILCSLVQKEHSWRSRERRRQFSW